MSISVDMSVEIAGIKMRNPVMVASGTFGYGVEYAEMVDLNQLGAVVVKGICMEPCDGNVPPRMVEVPSGLVNAIGLQGPGVKGFVNKYLPFLRQFDTPVLVNIWGRTIDEYGDVAAAFDAVEGIAGLELNISCPNVKAGGIAFGTDLKMAAKVISTVRQRTKLPLIPKLSPNVAGMGAFAKMAQDEGADAISLINTLPALVIDVETRRPVLSNGVGGLSGPGIHHFAVKQVWDAARAVSIPIIGMGGIYEPEDAIRFLLAGASAVAVGTANFSDPGTAARVIDGISAYLLRHGYSSVREIVGSLQYGQGR
ncbi:MAG: dihydroorotate dehydrogenase [Kiritimatiellia bacterium]